MYLGLMLVMSLHVKLHLNTWDGSEHGQDNRAHHAGQARDEEQQLAAFRDHLAGVLEDVPVCARITIESRKLMLDGERNG